MCGAATNESFFSPCSVSHDLRSNRPSLSVELDHASAHCRPAPFACHVCRTVTWLPDFSRKVGDARDQRHYPMQPLDNLLQAARARQIEDIAFGARFVRGGREGTAHGYSQSSDRRHIDFAPIRNSTRQHHSTRSRQEGRSDAISTGAMLGDFRYQRNGQCGTKVYAAHRVGDERQACPNTVRCLVHAGVTGIAAAVPRDADHRADTARHRVISASHRMGQVRARTSQKIRHKNDAGSDPGFAGDRTQADTVWQGTVGASALSGGDGAPSQRRRAGARCVVRILRCGQVALVEGAAIAGDRNGTERRGNPVPVCTALGYRIAVSQSEALVGREQAVTAKTHSVGAVDADSFHRMDAGSAVESGRGRIFFRCRRVTLARQTSADRRFGGAVVAHGIYRTCVSGRFQPEVRDIHLPGTVRRPKIAGVTLLSVADSKRFKQFNLNCVITPVTQW